MTVWLLEIGEFYDLNDMMVCSSLEVAIAKLNSITKLNGKKINNKWQEIVPAIANCKEYRNMLRVRYSLEGQRQSYTVKLYAYITEKEVLE